MADTALANQQQPTLVDKIVYLSSLAADQKKIDPMLDTLRVVTARQQFGGEMSAEDEEALRALYAQLLTYIVKEDPLRNFTLEDLERRVDKQFVGDTIAQKRRKLRSMLAGLWVFAFALYGLSFVVPLDVSPEVRPQLAAPVFLLALHIGMVWFFVSSLRDFKPELKHAYLLISLAVVNSGIAAAQFPLTGALELTALPVFAYGGFVVPFAVSCVLIYLGLRIFARQLDVRSAWLDWRVVVPVTVGFVALAVLLPHPAPVANEAFYDLSAGAMAAAIAVSFANAVLSWRIAARMTDLYRTAMRWFFSLHVVVMIGSLNYVVVLALRGELLGAETLLTLLPFIFLELTWLQAGYTFKKATYN